MMKTVEENQPPSGEDRSAFNAPPTSADSVAAMIGTKNLKIIIITMPFVFMAAVAVFIAVFGRPGERANAAMQTSLQSESVAPESLGGLSIPPLPVDGSDGIVLPKGAEIGSMAFDGDRLAVHVTVPGGVMIVVYDLQKNIVVQTIPVWTGE